MRGRGHNSSIKGPTLGPRITGVGENRRRLRKRFAGFALFCSWVHSKCSKLFFIRPRPRGTSKSCETKWSEHGRGGGGKGGTHTLPCDCGESPEFLEQEKGRVWCFGQAWHSAIVVYTIMPGNEARSLRGSGGGGCFLYFFLFFTVQLFSFLAK